MKSRNRSTRRSSKSRKARNTRKLRQAKRGGAKNVRLNMNCYTCGGNMWQPNCRVSPSWDCANCGRSATGYPDRWAKACAPPPLIRSDRW